MTVQELLSWIERYDIWAYGLLLAYCVGKTGPLPLVAGFVSSAGALELHWVLAAVMAGTVLGAQLRFWVGRLSSTWLLTRLPRLAPWIALGAAGVERYGVGLLVLYRFAKGVFSLVGVGAGVSQLTLTRFVSLDLTGAALWALTSVNLGYAIGLLGGTLAPEWAAYVGLALLLLGMAVTLLLGKRLKAALLPQAQQALHKAQEKRVRAAI